MKDQKTLDSTIIRVVALYKKYNKDVYSNPFNAGATSALEECYLDISKDSDQFSTLTIDDAMDYLK